MKWYLGIDVSKGYADFALLTNDLTQHEDTFQLDDTRQGHERLKDWIKALLQGHRNLEIDCGVESTGGFEDNWYAMLVEFSGNMPIRIARLNPLAVKNAAKAQLSANKTDSESAVEIARYLKRYTDQVDFTVRSKKFAAYRSLHNHLELVTKQKTQVINELKQLLYSSFPELQRYCKQSVPNWVLELLQQCKSPTQLAKTKPEKIARIKGVSLAKAQELVAKAKASVSSRFEPVDGFLLTQMALDIQQKQKKVKDLKEYLADTCVGDEVSLLQTIRGIGAYSAAAIMIQIEDIQRFATPQKLASYFGLHPVIRESGDQKRISRMSKQGRPAIRGILFMCANSAVLADPHMKAIYARHRANGKNHKQAIGVIMHKLLRVIWGVLSRKESYNAHVDAQNQQKQNRNSALAVQKETTRKRRMQSFDEEAPISRIAFKKRKVHATSQVGQADQMRDLVHEPDGKI